MSKKEKLILRFYLFGTVLFMVAYGVFAFEDANANVDSGPISSLPFDSFIMLFYCMYMAMVGFFTGLTKKSCKYHLWLVGGIIFAHLLTATCVQLVMSFIYIPWKVYDHSLIYELVILCVYSKFFIIAYGIGKVVYLIIIALDSLLKLLDNLSKNKFS